MKNNMLVLALLVVVMPVYGAVQPASAKATVTKSQIEQALEKTRQEVSSLYKRISPRYDKEEMKIRDQENRELETVRQSTAKQIEEIKVKAAAASKKVNDKYDPQMAKLYTQRDTELKNQIGAINSKKYGLKKDLAQIIEIPFSITLFKEMVIAADEHNKDKLRRLLSDYFAIMAGNDWRKFLRKTGRDMGAETVETIEIIDKTSFGSIITPLAALYFKVPRPISFDDIAKLEVKFMESIFEVAE